MVPAKTVIRRDRQRVNSMATERQIAANRANAKRSTGPKTTAGKQKSSGNAYRHGLSGPVLSDFPTLAKVALIVSEVAGEQATEDQLTSAADFARAQIELLRIRVIRTKQLAKINLHDGNNYNIQDLRQLAALDRYERYALTKRREHRKSCDPGVNRGGSLFAKTNPIFGPARQPIVIRLRSVPRGQPECAKWRCFSDPRR